MSIKKIFSVKNTSLIISSCFLLQNPVFANQIDREARMKYLLERARARQSQTQPQSQVNTKQVIQQPSVTTTSGYSGTTSGITTDTSQNSQIIIDTVKPATKVLNTEETPSGGKVRSTRYRDDAGTSIKIPDMPASTLQESPKGKVLSTGQVTTTQSSTQQKLERQAQEEALEILRQERIAQEKAAKEAERRLKAEQEAKAKAENEAKKKLADEKRAQEKAAKDEEKLRNQIAREAERKAKAAKLAEGKAAKAEKLAAERAVREEKAARAKIAKETERKAKAEKRAAEKAAREEKIAQAKAEKQAKELETRLAKEAELKAKAEQKLAMIEKQEEPIQETQVIESEKIIPPIELVKEEELINPVVGIIEPLDENEDLTAGLDPLEIKPLTEEDKAIKVETPKVEEVKKPEPKPEPVKKVEEAKKPEPKVEPAKEEPKKETVAKVPESTITEPAVKTDAERDNDYQMIVKKSLKSLEEDSWNDVKYNMKQNLDYFSKERTTYHDPKVEKYYKVSLAFTKFAEAGLELDQGDFADFEEAESLYLDAQDILEEVERGVDPKDPSNKTLVDTIGSVKKYISEELQYIEEMVGIE